MPQVCADSDSRQVFVCDEKRDDTRERAKMVVGALRAALELLDGPGGLCGNDDLQRDTIKAAVNNTIDAITEVESFIKQRRQAQQ